MAGKHIKLSRGDYAQLSFSLMSEENPYILDGDDYLLFTVKPNLSVKEPVIIKRIPANDTGTYSVELLSEDTKDLSPGDYIWDIRICPRSGKVHTPMFKAPFELVGTVGDNE